MFFLSNRVNLLADLQPLFDLDIVRMSAKSVVNVQEELRLFVRTLKVKITSKSSIK